MDALKKYSYKVRAINSAETATEVLDMKGNRTAERFRNLPYVGYIENK